MAFVTRCPYCGSIWLLPDKDTAERGPVCCSSCNNSFDATRALLCVDDSALPNLPKSSLRRTVDLENTLIKPAANPAKAESFAPSFLQKRVAEPDASQPVDPVVKPVEAPAKVTPTVKNEVAEKPAQAQTVAADSVLDTKAHVADKQPLHPTPEQAPEAKVPESDNSLIHVNRSNEPKLCPVSSTLRTGFAGKTEPSLHFPAGVSQKKEPVLHIDSSAPATPKNTDKPESIEHIVPAEDTETPVKVVMAPEENGGLTRKKSSRSYTGVLSVMLAIVLLVALAFVSAIVFNQKIIAAFPQTQETFTKLCGKVPCPGFFMAQPEAFVVSKTTLRPVDESGNYTLDVTLINGSNFAQAVPWLELEFVDDDNGTIMKRSITPQDYLSDPQSTKSIPPNRPLTIRVSLQTNVTSARCVVKPTYPNNR